MDLEQKRKKTLTLVHISKMSSIDYENLVEIFTAYEIRQAYYFS